MSMSRDEIVACLARRAEAWARLDAEALTADYADDGVVESPLAGGITSGPVAIRKLFEAYFQAFPDFSLQQEDLLIDGDRAVLIATISGTDRGGFMGLAATGRAVQARAVLCYTFRDGRIVRERRIYDFTGVLVQVGAIRAKPV